MALVPEGYPEIRSPPHLADGILVGVYCTVHADPFQWLAGCLSSQVAEKGGSLFRKVDFIVNYVVDINCDCLDCQ